MTASVPARLSLALLLASLLASPPLAATASVPGAARPPRIANGSGPTPTYLPTADAAALASGDADRTVRDAFLGPDAPGAMLVRGVPGYARARADALRSLALCAASPEGRDAFVSAEAWERDHGDGLFSKMSVAAPADGRLPVELDRACGAALRPKLEALRAAADAAATAVLPRLDELLGYDTGGFFAAAAKSSSSLDHFHVYAPSASAARVEASDGVPTDTRDQRTVSQRDRNTVDDVGVSSDEAFGSRTHAAGKREHVDVGVAIVMTPAFLVNGDVSVSSRDEALERFSEELDAFGSRGLTLGGRAPELPPDALIVMLGEAARAWAPPPPKGASAADAVAVPTHAMALALARRAGDAAPPSSRAWFGRMVLPPDATSHPTSPGTTFGAWREGVARAFRGGEGSGTEREALASVSCSPRRRLADDSSCGAGEVYCWLACVSDTSGGCGADEVLKCVEPGTGAVWPDDLGAQSHCYDCAPTCVAESGADADADADATSTSSASTRFCNDRIAPVSMYMDGFLGWSDPNGPCVAFLHRDLILRSPGLLFAAFFATVAAGVAVEGLAAARRWRAKTQDAACLDAIAVGGNPTAVSMALKSQALLLYGTQCSAGYLLMLVSMTYHAVLFLGVVLGLVLGHACFNAAAPLGARGGASACCQHVAAELGPDEDEPGPTSRLEDEHPDGGSSGSGGSVDDHSSLDSLNKDLIARRGSGRRGVEMGNVPRSGPGLV